MVSSTEAIIGACGNWRGESTRRYLAYENASWNDTDYSILFGMADEADDANEDPVLVDWPRAIEAWATHSITLLCQLIEAGPSCDREARDNLGHLINHLPVLCSDAQIAVRASRVYAAVVFYERVRLQKVDSNYFLDGLPRDLPVFGAPVALEFPIEKMRELTYADVMAERLHTVGKLDEKEPGSKGIKDLQAVLDKLPDVHGSVPLVVRLFISRVRSMCAGIKNAFPTGVFKQCCHAQCNRQFMSAGPLAGDAKSLRGSFDQQAEVAYWEHVERMPVYMPGPRACCSRHCYTQWKRQITELLPDHKIVYESAPNATYEDCTLASVRKAFDASMARNSRLKAAITKSYKKRKHTCKAVKRVDLDREVDLRITRTNVDSGVLYVSSLLAAQPLYASNLSLPGMCAEWRGTSAVYHKCVRRVRGHYEELKESRPIIDLLSQPAFFRRLKTHAVGIFA